MLAKVTSCALIGLDGVLVDVEVNMARGLPGLTIVGLPDAAVQESRERVRAAIANSGLTFPQQRLTVNLAPAGVRKSGAGLDLPIAIGILAACGALEPDHLATLALVGELALDGRLRAVRGALARALCLADLDRTTSFGATR